VLDGPAGSDVHDVNRFPVYGVAGRRMALPPDAGCDTVTVSDQVLDRDRQASDRTTRGVHHEAKTFGPGYPNAAQPLMVVIFVRGNLDHRCDVARGEHANHY
jgi:hypothetical protein